MSETKTRFWVIRPEGVRWIGLYRGEAAAWSHLMGVKRIPNTRANRNLMMKAGWRVVEEDKRRS